MTKSFASKVLFDSDLPLRWSDVKPSTATKYTTRVSAFFRWVRNNEVAIGSYEELDDGVELYMNYLYLKESGGRRQAAAELLCGLYRRFPRSRGRLLASVAALKSWTKCVPGKAYLPLVWGVALVVAHQIAKHAKSVVDHYAAIAVPVAHHCLLRVGELLRLRAEDVVFNPIFSVKSAATASLRIRSAKTGADQYVRVTDPVIVLLLRRLIRSTQVRTDRIFRLSYSQLRLRFRQALHRLGLDTSRIVFHSLRHGGATELALRGTDLGLIALRGRWRSLKNAGHYVQTGESLVATVRLPSPFQEFAHHLVRDWTLWGPSL